MDDKKDVKKKTSPKKETAKKTTPKKKPAATKKAPTKKPAAKKPAPKKVEAKKEEVKKEVPEKEAAQAKKTEKKAKTKNESLTFIAIISVLLVIVIIYLISVFGKLLREDTTYKNAISEYCKQTEKVRKEEIEKEVKKYLRKDTGDKKLIKDVTCEYGETVKLKDKDLKDFNEKNKSDYKLVYETEINIKIGDNVEEKHTIYTYKENNKWQIKKGEK